MRDREMVKKFHLVKKKGRMDRLGAYTTLSLCKIQKDFSQNKATSSKNHLAEMMVTKKTIKWFRAGRGTSLRELSS